jgi:hypothetical protein
MSKKISKQHKELYHTAVKYLNLGVLFKEKPKISELNPYKIGKINKALKSIYAVAGNKQYLEKDFAPVKSKRLIPYNRANQLPDSFKGVLITGAVKLGIKPRINADLGLTYIRGAYGITTSPINMLNETTIEQSIEANRSLIEKSETTYLSANGAIIPSIGKKGGYRQDHTPTDLILEKALFLYSKYSQMAANQEMRYDTTRINKKTGEYYQRGIAQAPKMWGAAIMYETVHVPALTEAQD